jgi:hypothetical protein
MSDQSKHAPERPEWMDQWLDNAPIAANPTTHPIAAYIRYLEASAKETAAELAEANGYAERLLRSIWPAETHPRFEPCLDMTGKLTQLDHALGSRRVQIEETAAELAKHETRLKHIALLLRHNWTDTFDADEVVDAVKAMAADRDQAWKHYADCANTPLMSDVMAERDRLRETNRELVKLLTTLDRIGGLGIVKREWIRNALARAQSQT